MNKLRTQMIINYLEDHSYASFSSLCDIFQVSPATMRRDLTALERDGQLIRVHGGVKSIDSNNNGGMFNEDRFHIAVDEKRKIAKYVASQVKDNESILLDSSTTNCFVAEELAKSNLHLTIVTNDIMISDILRGKQNILLVVIGGYVRENGRGMVGPFAEKALKGFYVDKAFLGFDSVSIKSGVSIKSNETLLVKKQEIKIAQKRYLVGESSKFNKNFYYKLCNLNDIDEIVTDSALPNDIYTQYIKANKKVTRV